MNKINIEKWEYFKINNLFNIKKGKTLSVENKIAYEGNVECINGSAKNNGILTYLDENIKNEGFEIQKAPALSLSRVGNSGLALFQNKDFFIADNAYSLKLKETNYDIENVYLFISSILNKEIYKYSYGRIINNKYFETKIKLPANKCGNRIIPNYEFMNLYIKNIKSKIVYNPIYSNNKGKKKLEKYTNWKKIKISELFNVYGSRTTKVEDLISKYGFGEYPYITTKAVNNGVENHFDFYTEKRNVITVDSAVNGYITYQDTEFSASDHVEVLEPKNATKFNKQIALFIKTILNKGKYKYGYGRKFNQERIKNTILILPYKDGKPDWDYMENYIKNIPYGDLI